PLLPGRQPRPGRDQGRLHRAVQAPARHPRRTPRRHRAGRLEPRPVHQAPARRVHAGEPLQPGQVDVSPVTGARRRAGRDDAGAGAAGARARILDAAVRLVSERGAAATSMRQLAAACDLNVATIYHYFPSKADLLRAIIEERRYGERMASEDPPMQAELAPRDRFEGFMAWLVEPALDERTILRLLVAEGLHGNETARDPARARLRALDGAIEAWLDTGFPELGPATPPPVAARLVRRVLLSAVLEQLVTGAPIGDDLGRDLAAALFGSG